MLLINGALIFFLVQGPKRGPHRDRQNADLKERISHKLNFNKDQKSAYIKLAQEHRKNMQAVRKEQKELVKAYFELLASSAPDLSKKESLTEEIKSLEARKLSITYQHFEDLKAICVEDQLLDFESVIKDILPVFTGSEGRSGRPARPPGR